PTAVFNAVERRIERAVFDFEHVGGSALDGVGDGVAMRRPKREGAEDQHVERALQHFALERRSVSFRHKLRGDYTPVDDRVQESTANRSGLMIYTAEIVFRSQESMGRCAMGAECGVRSNAVGVNRSSKPAPSGRGSEHLRAVGES